MIQEFKLGQEVYFLDETKFRMREKPLTLMRGVVSAVWLRTYNIADYLGKELEPRITSVDYVITIPFCRTEAIHTYTVNQSKVFASTDDFLNSIGIPF